MTDVTITEITFDTRKVIKQPLTLDLNGHTVRFTNYNYSPITVTEGGSLTIEDSSMAKSGKMIFTQSYSYTPITVSSGSLYIKGGTIEGQCREIVYVNTENGSAEFTGGTFNAKSISRNTSNLQITGGTLNIVSGSTITDDDIKALTPFGTAAAKITKRGQTEPACYVVGADDIAATAASLLEGDTLDIIKGSFTADIDVNALIVKNSGGSVTVNGQSINLNNHLKLHTHKWQDPEWVYWSPDYSVATAKMDCEGGESVQNLIVGTVGTVKTAATCDKPGIMTYTASFDIDGKGKTYTTAIDVENIPATGEHSFKDGKCTVCGSADPNYKADDTADAKVDSSAGTGDSFYPLTWVMIILLAAGGTACIFIRSRDRRTE